MRKDKRHLSVNVQTCKPVLPLKGFPGGSDGKESACNADVFDPWVGKILWRKKWLLTPVFLPGESDGQRSLVGQSMVSQRVGYDSVLCDRCHRFSNIVLSFLFVSSYFFDFLFFFFSDSLIVQKHIVQPPYVCALQLFLQIVSNLITL